MNAAVLSWVKHQLSTAEVTGKIVLEVGSYNINGTVRDVVMPLNPQEYTGVDIRPGPCVDEVCDICNLTNRFGAGAFDLVICCSTLSHVQHWEVAISNIKGVCKPGGIILIVATGRWPYRDYPQSTEYRDWWRYSCTDMRHIFSDCQILSLGEIKRGKTILTCMKAKEPVAFKAVNLGGYQLKSARRGMK